MVGCGLGASRWLAWREKVEYIGSVAGFVNVNILLFNLLSISRILSK